ncbi:hypothetical protein TWF569_008662 [Orbilia oligospora]|nr:hypothetical protein TWF569_008662 [Orbilia oligospora]KAF3157314.1 hypothetical protein TWF751_002422 [Orbilia oligospora]
MALQPNLDFNKNFWRATLDRFLAEHQRRTFTLSANVAPTKNVASDGQSQYSDGRSYTDRTETDTSSSECPDQDEPEPPKRTLPSLFDLMQAGLPTENFFIYEKMNNDELNRGLGNMVERYRECRIRLYRLEVELDVESKYRRLFESTIRECMGSEGRQRFGETKVGRPQPPMSKQLGIILTSAALFVVYVLQEPKSLYDLLPYLRFLLYFSAGVWVIGSGVVYVFWILTLSQRFVATL